MPTHPTAPRARRIDVLRRGSIAAPHAEDRWGLSRTGRGRRADRRRLLRGDDTAAEDTSATRYRAVGRRRSRSPTRARSSIEGDGSFLVGQSIDAEIHVWDEPGEPDEFTRTLKAADETSGILTFLVEERRSDGWLKVRLPVAPVGGEGYVVEGDVALSRHRYAIEVSRSTHTLEVIANGIATFDEPVAIGPDAPPADTATYVKEVLLAAPGQHLRRRTPTPTGSPARPTARQQFADGRGVVAIHAVLDPATLGHDAPAGAIGMDRDRARAPLREHQAPARHPGHHRRLAPASDAASRRR